jgi:hypothetical protein
MAKYRPYSRRVLRQRLRAWLAAYAKEISVAGLAAGLFIAVEAALLLGLGTPGPIQWFSLGAISALLVATLVAGLGLGFLVSDPVALHQIRGAWGEENTRDQLKRARRKGHIWGWVDSVTLAVGDVDHIVVTRHGGLIAIDSKWRTRVDPAGRDAMVREASDSRRRAEGVVRTVLSRERSGRRADGKSLRVRPAVVLWGSSQSSLPDAATFADVEFVRGRDLIRWLETLDGDAVDQGPAEALLTSLEKYRATAWVEQPAERADS